MGSIKSIFASMTKNMKTWRINVRVYVVLVLLFAFLWNNLRSYGEIAAYFGVPVSICVFPFFISRNCMEFIFGAIAMLLFGEAPFTDQHAPFTVIRSGRRNWIIGKVLYIWVTSLLYTLIAYLMSILVLLPNVQLELDWGQVMWTMALETEELSAAGFSFVAPWDVMMNAMSGLEGVLLSLLLYWLVTVFLGMVILFFNTVVKKGLGLVVAGFFVGLSYFANIFGATVFGNKAKWVSPVSWRGYNSLALSESSDLPPIPYAITVLIVSIIIMAVVSVIVFCKKDLEFEKGEY